MKLTKSKVSAAARDACLNVLSEFGKGKRPKANYGYIRCHDSNVLFNIQHDRNKIPDAFSFCVFMSIYPAILEEQHWQYSDNYNPEPANAPIRVSLRVKPGSDDNLWSVQSEEELLLVKQDIARAVHDIKQSNLWAATNHIGAVKVLLDPDFATCYRQDAHRAVSIIRAAIRH